MKKLLPALMVIASMLVCSAALADPPLPPKSLLLDKKLIISDDVKNPNSHISWIIKEKLAPSEYFALAFLEKLASTKAGTVAVTFSEDGQQWSNPVKFPLKGKSSGEVMGADITHHNWGILQGFAHDFKAAQVDRLFGLKLADKLKMNPAPPAFPVSNVGPPATVISRSGDQLIACNVKGEMTLFKGKMDNAAGFNKVVLDKSCEKKVTGRPDIAFKKNKLLMAWSVAGKGIWTALYGVNQLGRLEFIKCKLALYQGAAQPGDRHVYEITSDPVLAACDETFYIGVASIKQGESAPKFRIWRSADAANWSLKHELGGGLAKHSKLGLAAKLDGSLFAAMVEKTAAGVKASSWLWHRDQQLNWQWIDLGDKPWMHVMPDFKYFGADSGGVRR